MRLATWGSELSRPGPGVLLRDIVRGEDAQITAAISVIARLQPDILLLTDFDHDPGGATLAAFTDALEKAGAPYPHTYAPPSNAGMPSNVDLDGDGRLGTPRDAQGFGRFRGDGGMVLLSRLPVLQDSTRDHSGIRWVDVPGAELPRRADGSPFLSPEALEIQRLSSTGHWVIPVRLAGGQLFTVLAFAATPPVFDGPEDRNGLRNAAEITFWMDLLAGPDAPGAPFALLGRANLDPEDGEGRHAAIRTLLSHPALQDAAPQSPGARAAADPDHTGLPGTDTAEWPSREGLPGNLRVDYVLPSSDLEVVEAGVDWPAGEAEEQRAASRHRLVWVDIRIP